eukprot:TRINITY_DN1271_c0_g1_i1.p1 TRINITY_DN1271_c0_g1~~TRINITY_DN1271_c0_g1_i1.p1  ORF type:complete len:315 (-),score=63.16 TRINITY_DN1271_c0_g1_i1:758-1702(-)
MAAPNPGQKQVMKFFTLFNVESYDEKKAGKSKELNISTDLWSFSAIQGMTIFGDLCYILATMPSADSKEASKDMLVIYSKGATLAAVQVHHKNSQIWGFDNGKSKFVVTIGQDQEAELVTTIKIWDPEQLLENKYAPLEDYDKPVLDKKLFPRRIPLDLAVSRNKITAMAVAEDMTAVALGFDTGESLCIRTTKQSYNLFVCADRELQYMQLKPEQEYALAVNNIYVVSPNEKNKHGVVYCGCSKGLYCYSIDFRAKFMLIAKDIEVLPRAMDCREDSVIVFASNTNELRIYREMKLESALPLKEKGVSYSLIR